MRNWPIIALTVSLGLALAVIPAGSQTRTFRAPRTPDGKPDVNGIWQALNEAYWDVEAHAAAPSPVLELGAAHAVAGGLSIIDGGTITKIDPPDGKNCSGIPILRVISQIAATYDK